MKHTITIHIPQPCHEDWQQMTPVNNGRYCQSCAKQVVDFSLMTDQQVLNYLSTAASRVCGRFAEDQLQRPLQPAKQEKKKIWWVAAALPLLMVFGRATAQKKKAPTKKVVAIPATWAARTQGLISPKITPAPTVGDTVISTGTHISGRVITATGQPVAFTSIHVTNYPASAMADSAGYFTLQLHSVGDSISLEASAIGYENVRLPLAGNQNNGVSIVLKDVVNKLPDVVVKSDNTECLRGFAGGLSIVRSYTFRQRTATLVRDIFKAPAFDIYPNPAQRGQAITIDTKKQGQYSIQLFTNSGKLLAVQEFEAMEGGTITKISIPSSAAVGVYFIRLVDGHTKKQYSSKLVVF